MKSHQKHIKLAKPHANRFARNEWAILGTTCENIRRLAENLARELTPEMKIAYADADHKSADEGESLRFDFEFTDKARGKRQEARGKGQGTICDFNDADLAFVNGNHFEAARQLVALDPKKAESLSRKIDRLTRVDAFLAMPASPAELPDFLKNHLPDWKNIPVLPFDAPAAIAAFLKEKISPPPLLGLVLAGGRSTRMGRDKSMMEWHGQPQREHLAAMLESLDIPAHFSCRAEQVSEFAENQRVVPDSFLELGPFGAILSAFRERPDAAWLVLACDLPLLDADTLKHLISNRRPAAVATAFRSPTDESRFPEPLITIWEPKAYLHLLRFLAMGVSCPRKVLINSDVHLLDAPDGEKLMNVNTPEDIKRLNTHT